MSSARGSTQTLISEFTMDEYAESTLKGKFYFYGWLLLLVLAVVGLDRYEQSFKKEVRPESVAIEQWVEEINDDARETLLVIVAIQPIFWFVAYLLYRYGKRIKASGRYPPPGAQMPFRMKVKKGKKALFQAAACNASAILVIISSFMYVYLGWLSMKSVERLLAGV